MAEQYQRREHNGDLIGYRRLSDGADIPLSDDNADYLALAALIDDGYEPLAADPPPETPPTPAEQFDAVIDRAQEALTGATTLAAIKAVFAGTLDGLRDIYGTGGGS